LRDINDGVAVPLFELFLSPRAAFLSNKIYCCTIYIYIYYAACVEQQRGRVYCSLCIAYRPQRVVEPQRKRDGRVGALMERRCPFVVLFFSPLSGKRPPQPSPLPLPCIYTHSKTYINRIYSYANVCVCVCVCVYVC